MNIGANIKKYRKEKGLTQQQLADLIGKSTIGVRKYEANDIKISLGSSLARYENGTREPKIGTLNEIAKVLDVSIQELITGEK